MKKILTIILDGFGMREESDGNAIKDADMTCFNSLWEEYPHSLLKASEEAVGLNKGQFGNSETGHQTIGAGRLIKQNETLVNEFLHSNVEENENFQKLLLKKDKDIHLMGLCSDGNVHGGIDDFINIYELLLTSKLNKIQEKKIIICMIDKTSQTNLIKIKNNIEITDQKIIRMLENSIEKENSEMVAV